MEQGMGTILMRNEEEFLWRHLPINSSKGDQLASPLKDLSLEERAFVNETKKGEFLRDKSAQHVINMLFWRIQLYTIQRTVCSS